jgi:hypothetical protein
VKLWPGSRRTHAAPQRATSWRFKRLPERVDPKRTITSKQAHPPRDPEGGRDTDRDFMLRYGAGGDEWDVGDG